MHAPGLAHMAVSSHLTRYPNGVEFWAELPLFVILPGDGLLQLPLLDLFAELNLVFAAIAGKQVVDEAGVIARAANQRVHEFPPEFDGCRG